MNDLLKIASQEIKKSHIKRWKKSLTINRGTIMEGKRLLEKTFYRGHTIMIYKDEIGQFDVHIYYKEMIIFRQCMMELYDQAFIYGLSFVDGYIQALDDGVFIRKNRPNKFEEISK